MAVMAGVPREIRRRLLIRSVVGITCCASVLCLVALSYADGETRRVALENGIDSDLEQSVSKIMQVCLHEPRHAGWLSGRAACFR
jgi:hypothetical protein